MSRFLKIYRWAAALMLNTILLLILFNMGAWAIHFARENKWRFAPHRGKKYRYFQDNGNPYGNGRIHQYLMFRFDYDAVKDVPEEQMYETLTEFGDAVKNGMEFTPYTHFAEPPFKGKWVNIVRDPVGHPTRLTLNPPPDDSKKTVKVWMFGGSTTFGYFVADHQTIPSYLSSILNDSEVARKENLRFEVTNYGHGYYYSTPESILAAQSVKRLGAPDFMLFLDGVNESLKLTDDNAAAFFPISHGMDLAQDITPRGDRLRFWALVNSFAIGKVFMKFPWTSEPVTDTGEKMYARYRFNHDRSADLARDFGITAHFFIQPDARYNYPFDRYAQPRTVNDHQRRKLHTPFHELAQKAPDLSYLGDLMASGNPGEKLLLDDVHYTPKFSESVARRVSEVVLKDFPRASSRMSRIAHK